MGWCWPNAGWGWPRRRCSWWSHFKCLGLACSTACRCCHVWYGLRYEAPIFIAVVASTWLCHGPISRHRFALSDDSYPTSSPTEPHFLEEIFKNNDWSPTRTNKEPIFLPRAPSILNMKKHVNKRIYKQARWHCTPEHTMACAPRTVWHSQVIFESMACNTDSENPNQTQGPWVKLGKCRYRWYFVRKEGHL